MVVLETCIAERIETRLIKPSQFVLRNKFNNKDPEDEQLLQSIKNHSLLQPILIRPMGDSFEIVAGHRRFKACRSLRWRFIPCNIAEVSDKQAYELQLTENMQRKSMNSIEEAEAFRRYVTDFGWGGISELAKKIGKSQEYVSHKIQLLNLADNVKDQIISNQIKSSHAAELISLSHEKQIELVNLMKDESITVKQIRKIKMGLIDEIEETQFNELSSKKHKTIRTMRKMTLVLKVTLARIDDIIEETKNSSKSEQDSSLIVFLMGMRLKIHSMIDENIHFKNCELKIMKGYD